MGRPALRDERKRKSVSISLRQDILALAEATENKSRFFESSVEVCRGIQELFQKLEAGEVKKTDIVGEIEDMIVAWKAQFEPPSRGTKRRP